MAKPESFELDHVFVCGPAGEAAIAPIVNAGFRVGINREHPGQGTYNTCFFFDNAYLELFHLRREEDTQSPAIAPLSLSQRLRWRDTDACPFGMSLRPAPGNHDCPFATWDYAAPYLPPGVAIPII